MAVALGGPSLASAQTPDPGRQAFEVRCARCHGGDGSGGPMGPSIVQRIPNRDDSARQARGWDWGHVLILPADRRSVRGVSIVETQFLAPKRYANGAIPPR